MLGEFDNARGGFEEAGGDGFVEVIGVDAEDRKMGGEGCVVGSGFEGDVGVVAVFEEAVEGYLC